ncbi:MAG TPA: LPS assembly lipoprotein LptE [Anaeromyxobacter sp.]|nr:LPS assembly lipoprotein LptE [Anaeromyxobacter sp.]
MPRAPPAALLLLALAGCGYRVVTPYRARGGIDRIHVGVFENDSADPELGAAVTAAMRDELARRGAYAGADAPAQLDGVVRAASGTPSSYFSSATAVSVQVHVRLSVDGKLVQELTVQRTEPHEGGADPLESEGRRATAVRKLARDAAREVLRELEEPPPSGPAGTGKS